MKQPNDIRWHQRLQNFQSAFNELDEAVALSNERGLSKLEEQGLIQVFEYTYELAWNTIKDFYPKPRRNRHSGQPRCHFPDVSIICATMYNIAAQKEGL